MASQPSQVVSRDTAAAATLHSIGTMHPSSASGEEWEALGQGAPHGRKGGGPRDDGLTRLLRVESGHQILRINRATGLSDTDKIDGTAPVQPAHQRDFPPTEGAGVIEPDSDARCGHAMAYSL